MYSLEYPWMASKLKLIAVRSAYESPVRVAQACSRRDQRIQHRLQVEGRAADDFEHVGGGGLLLSDWRDHQCAGAVR